MTQLDSTTVLSTLAYPLSLTLIIGFVSLGIIARGWSRMVQKKQDARMQQIVETQKQLESLLARHTDAMATRVESWGRDMHSQLGGHAQQLKVMHEAVGSLKTALVVPHLRGRILGETALERLLGDVLPPHAYAFQFEIGSSRVDAVIRFPHVGLVVPIDAKFHFAAAQTLLEGSVDSSKINDARRQLAQAVRASARDIAQKYVRPELGTTDFAYLFIPSEAVFMEVLHDVELWQSLVDERVLVVSPHTLFVALQPLSHAIRYYEMSLGVDEKIRALQGAQQSLHVMSEQLNALLGKAAKAIEMSQSLVRDIPEAAALKPMVVHGVGHAADATSTLPQ